MADRIGFNDLFVIGRNEVLTRAPKLDAVLKEGSDANALVAAGAAVGEEVLGQVTALEAALFLDSAKGRDLDKLVFDRYGITRKPAAPALGSVSFSTVALTGASFLIPLGTLLGSTDGLKWKTTQDATFPANSTGPVVVPVESIVAGGSQRAAPSTIKNILATISGAAADLKVNNPLATNRGDDEELDESLRSRARGFFTSARRGTLKALEQGALAVPGVRTAAAIEVLDALGRPARFVQLIVSDQFTADLVNQAVVPPAYATQSQQLAVKVLSNLSDVRPAGIHVQVLVGQIVVQPIQLQLTFIAGVDVDDVAFQARTAIVNHVNLLKAGQTLTVKGMIDALKLVPGLLITESEIASPSGDVVAKSLQLIRTSVPLVTAVSVQSDRQLTATTNPDAYIKV